MLFLTDSDRDRLSRILEEVRAATRAPLSSHYEAEIVTARLGYPRMFVPEIRNLLASNPSVKRM